ncbi:hypothetical protein V6N11_082335 [Hibiscus sabdariffa]|uniref:Uncharacterized protein n=1 Tax=Hibiscus sabdariffa TaxID=183260 RepID=A0ABR2PC80_9ROSI
MLLYPRFVGRSPCSLRACVCQQGMARGSYPVTFLMHVTSGCLSCPRQWIAPSSFDSVEEVQRSLSDVGGDLCSFITTFIAYVGEL